MPENIPSFENVPAADLEKISAEVARRREMPEHAGKDDAELVKHALRDMTSAATEQKTEGGDMPDYMKDAPSGAQRELEHYLQETVTDGIDKAARDVASSNPFLMDAFHDALSGPLYEELKKRGMLS